MTVLVGKFTSQAAFVGKFRQVSEYGLEKLAQLIFKPKTVIIPNHLGITYKGQRASLQLLGFVRKVWK